MSYEEEIRIQGVPVSEGIAIGIPFFLSVSQEEIIPEFPITVGEVDDEIARYRRALFSSKEDLEKLQCDLAIEGSQDAVTIIDTHIQMLKDPMMTTHMEEQIRQMRQNTESVFRSVISDYERRFSQTSNSFFQQRLVDVMDLSKRILGHLNPREKFSLSDIPPNSVVFAKELIPSDTAEAQATSVSAFVTQMGGGNSHAALIARAKGIPFVANIDMELLQNVYGKCVIVDGISGEIIFNPSGLTLKRYGELKSRLKKHYTLLEQESSLASETVDGYPIKVYANAGSINELDPIFPQGASGIGLFRTEYLFLRSPDFFVSEEHQYTAYREVIEKAPGLPVVIRVFDLGGDKYSEEFAELRESPSSFLGCRGIRFLLRRKDIFKTQLRALLRAGRFGNIKILLPLISDVKELLESKELIKEVQEELHLEQIPFKRNIPIGCMIEVPSAVLICDILAQQSDFLSIGTNDLVQYTLGVDRSCTIVGDACFPVHPSIVRMIKMIVLAGRLYDKPVTICGEFASNPLIVPMLLGLGIDEFSCSPRYIPIIKRVIRRCSVLQTYALAEKILQSNTTSEITQLLLEGYTQAMRSD